MELGLAGKHVLVTGSSRGIGYGIALEYLREGARVCITGRDKERLIASKELLISAVPGGIVEALTCDFSSVASVECLKSQLEQVWQNQLDVLVANVGSGSSTKDLIPVHQEFERVMNENFYSTVHAVRAFLPLLEISKGSVVVISSIAGIEALSAPIAYASAKAGLNAFVKTLSRSYPQTKVRVNVVAPGNILFPEGSWSVKLAENPVETDTYVKTRVPMQRFGFPDEIGRLVVFLGSKASSFIHGSVVIADGGQTVRF